MSGHIDNIQGLIVFDRPTFVDDRGFFHEVFQVRELESILKRPVQFVQSNHSRSGRDVLRGMHAEDWDKLVYVARGEVLTAVADLRPDSPTFGQAQTFRLGDDNRQTVFIPRGLAHGYYVLSDEADYVYQASAYYDGSDTRAVAWDDPDLRIAWPTSTPVVSARDRANPSMRELFPAYFMGKPLPHHGAISTPVLAERTS